MDAILKPADSNVKHVLVSLQRDLVIGIDSREKVPWRNFRYPTQTVTLPTGDYSIVGMEHEVAIERKSLNDLCGCLTANRQRFEKELERARSLRKFWVIVEDDYSAFALGRYRSEMSTERGIESVAALTNRYGIDFLFAGNPPMAARLAESLLIKYFREHCRSIETVAKSIMNSRVEVA